MNPYTKGVIVGNGSHPPVETLKKLATDDTFLLSADGGIRYFREAELIPHLLLGDMDSADPQDIRYFTSKGVSIQKYPSEKDETDMELAVRLLEEKGIRKIAMLGASGNRLDHTFFNAMLLLAGLKRGTEIVMIDKNNEIRALQREMTIKKREGYLSVIPVDETVMITLKGVKYPLERKIVERDTSLTVSNEIVADEASVICHYGNGLLFLSGGK